MTAAVASPARAAARPELAAAAAQAAQLAQLADPAPRPAEGAVAVVRRRKWDARLELAALARLLAPRLAVPRRLAVLAQQEKTQQARWTSSFRSCSEAWQARQGPLTGPLTQARRKAPSSAVREAKYRTCGRPRPPSPTDQQPTTGAEPSAYHC